MLQCKRSVKINTGVGENGSNQKKIPARHWKESKLLQKHLHGKWRGDSEEHYRSAQPVLFYRHFTSYSLCLLSFNNFRYQLFQITSKNTCFFFFSSCQISCLPVWESVPPDYTTSCECSTMQHLSSCAHTSQILKQEQIVCAEEKAVGKSKGKTQVRELSR